jgi:glycosyltransferase involved in cell wall biosynthesis
LAPLLNGAVHWLYRHRVSGVLTVAQANSRYLVQRGVSKAKVRVVHNGIAWCPAPVRTDSCASGRVFTIGVASRLDPIKGLDHLLQALAILRREGQSLRLMVLGDGPSRNNLELLARQLGLSDSVTFSGLQSNVPEWLAKFDLFVLPSLSEAHSVGLLEAMRAGLPIVATDVGGNGESVRDGQEALLVPPADAQALAAAIRTLSADVSLRGRLARAARLRYEKEFTEVVMRRRLSDWLLEFAPALALR